MMENTTDEQLKQQYLVESKYARQIQQSAKGSREREKLLTDGYDELTRLTAHTHPENTQYNHTNTITSFIKRRLAPGSKIFDLGCGNGDLLRKLVELDYEIEGIDVSNTLIQNAKKRLTATGRADAVRQADILSYTTGTTFDCVVMDNVIEHFHPDCVSDVLCKCYSLLNKEGYIIIQTPHRFSGPHDISKYFLPVGSKSTGLHLQEFSFTDLYNCLQQAGFASLLGFLFHPRLLHKINYIPDCSQWAGQKALYLEHIFEHTLLSATLTQNRNLSRMLVALLFPAVCAAQK